MNTRKRDYKFLLGYDIRIPTMILFWFNLIELSDVTDTKVWKVFLRRGIFVFSRGKKIMLIAEEEREGEGSNEPTLVRYVDVSIVYPCPE